MAPRRRASSAAPVRRRRSASRSRKAAPKAPQPLVIPVGERCWILDVPFDERGAASAAGARWNPDLKASTWTGQRLPAALVRYQTRPYTWPRLLEDTVNGGRPGPPLQVAPMPPGPLQIDGARAIIRHAAGGGRQFLLGDDAGVGKTITTIVAVKGVAALREASRVLVVADRPAQVTIGHWCRSIAAVGDGGLTWCVVTWDHLDKVKRSPWDIVVLDEAHLARYTTTKRWTHLTRICGFGRASRHPYVIATTATPAHSPLEMPYLALAFADKWDGNPAEWADDLGQSLADKGVGVTKGRYGWQPADDPRQRHRDIDTVRRWLSDQNPPALIHRHAPQGPAPIFEMPVDLTPAAMLRYLAEWGEFCTEMNLARRGSDTARGRAAVLRFRQKAGLLRVGVTGEWAAAQIDAGRQVAISVQYVETAADPLREWLEDHKIPVACMYGQGRFDTEAERLKFQTGAAPVVVFTPTASLSLHAGEQLGNGRHATTAPRVGIFHQARYSGIQGRQIVGRIHRDHQVAPWRVAYAAGTVEEQVAKVMVERYAASAQAVGGDTTAVQRIAQALGAAWLPPTALIDKD